MTKQTYPDWCTDVTTDPTEAMLQTDRSLKYMVMILVEVEQIQWKQLKALNTLRTAANLWVLLLVGGVVLACIFSGGLFSVVGGAF